VSFIQLFDLFCGNPRLRCPPILFKGLTASKLRLLQFPHGGSFKLSLLPPVPCSPIPALIPTLLLSLLWCCLSWPRDLGPGPQILGVPGTWFLGSCTKLLFLLWKSPTMFGCVSVCVFWLPVCLANCLTWLFCPWAAKTYNHTHTSGVPKNRALPLPPPT